MDCPPRRLAAVLISDILTGDGPDSDRADMWVRGELCESCMARPVEIDEFCRECVSMMIGA